MALSKHKRLTVADLRKLKGKRQLTMLFVETPEEAAAASAAGVDILSIIEPSGRLRCARRRAIASFKSASSTASTAPTEDYLRAAHKNLMIGGDVFLLRRQPRYDHQARGGGHTGRGPRRPHPRARDMERRIQGGGQNSRRSDASLCARQATRSRGRGRGRNRSRARACSDEIRNARRFPHVDGRRLRLRCAISVRRGRAGLLAWPQAASRQGLPQLSRRIRSACSANGSRLSRSSAPTSRRRAFPDDKHLVPIADAEFEAFMKGLEKR